jgi:hypothetical protein
LNTETTSGIFPFDRTIDAGNLTGPAFETTGKFDHHLSLFVKGVKVCWTGINTEMFFTFLTDFWVEENVGFFVVFKGIQSQFLGDLHQASPLKAQGVRREA